MKMKKKTKNEEKLYEKFRDNLRKEEFDISQKEDIYNINYTYIKEDKFQVKRYGEDYILERTKEDETPHNIYLRSLFVSAILRCIYCCLEKPANNDIKIKMIRTLLKNDKDDYIKMICNLCECTKFLENEIPSKFMVIMDHVLKNLKLFYEDSSNDLKSGIKRTEEEKYNEMLKRLGYISYVIKKIVRIKKRGLNLENDEHLTFASETCKCCSSLINQINNMKFSTDKAK